MTFVNGDKCLSDNIGKIQERNACRSPWTNTLDFRLNVGLPFKRVKAEITWDVLNLMTRSIGEAVSSGTRTSTICLSFGRRLERLERSHTTCETSW